MKKILLIGSAQFSELIAEKKKVMEKDCVVKVLETDLNSPAMCGYNRVMLQWADEVYLLEEVNLSWVRKLV